MTSFATRLFLYRKAKNLKPDFTNLEDDIITLLKEINDPVSIEELWFVFDGIYNKSVVWGKVWGLIGENKLEYVKGRVELTKSGCIINPGLDI